MKNFFKNKLFKKILISMLIALCLLGVGFVAYKKYEDNRLFSFKVGMIGQNSQVSVEYLLEKAKEDYGVRLKTTMFDAPYFKICLVQDASYASGLGYRLDGLGDSFVITKLGGSVYILAKTDEAMNRACDYLLHNLIGEDLLVQLQEGESIFGQGGLVKDDLYVGEVPIGQYVIVYGDKAAHDASEELRYLIHQTCGADLEVVKEFAGGNSIQLKMDETLALDQKDISIIDGQIWLSAANEDMLFETVYLFANTYMGWMNAGREDAQLVSKVSELTIPANVKVCEAPWIEEREAIITLWNINYNRGFWLNTDTSLENNLVDYSKEQLYEYVKMLKFCGFTGIQITEMCSTWAGVGGYERAHEAIRNLADAAHELDMNVTLWVWGAEFTGYGWVDETVVYSSPDAEYAYMVPEVVATFDKYYSIYAELADCVDRVIGHFYDPTNLHNAVDIAYFSKMLRDKFQAVNPDIDFGISCWVDVYDKNVFVQELGTDITLYESGHHDVESDYESFRGFVKDKGTRLGTWAWNTCEMEIDQLAQMNFNLDVIREVYQIAQKYDHISKPSYWSEMDSYHVLNVFSLYCAGQMLQNPEIQEEELMNGLTRSMVGEEYAEALAEMLYIIQDARTGHTWNTYRWDKEEYILKSETYDAKGIFDRCNEYIPILDEMIDKELESVSFPLPISLNELLSMMRPHLEQIRDFAEFRIAFDALEKDFQEGTSVEEIEARLYTIGQPVDSYNTIVGTWGQIEARAQREMIVQFCKENSLKLPIYGEYDRERKNFIYEQFAMYQRGEEDKVCFASPYYQYGKAFGLEETERLVEDMVKEGLLQRVEDGSVYLTDWENYRFHFN